MLTAQPLSPMLGADMTGIDLRNLVNAPRGEIEEIQGLIARHKVLRFRGQQLGPGELVELAKRFGPVRALRRASGGAAHIPEHPEIKVVSNVSRDGTVLGDGNSSELSWHTDGSYLDTPTALTFLYGRKAPTRQPPKTYFMDLQALYDNLPKTLTDFILPLKAIHYSVFAYAPEYAAEIQALPEGADRRHIGPKHPLVRRDPATGRLSLFPPRQRECLIEGLSAEESEKLSNVLWSVVERYQGYWGDSIEPGDLMLFDNSFSLHRREPFDATEERILWHVTTDGERPE
ncbi:TauD/TfdA family dioxygenase [Agrobacterium tumefaciens]|uniref:TauD/TfdA dioxygenase family protein n=1 Tax=Agrobacterium tumefaciens TaxID=358 RepID=UPI001571EAD1|nr:TauD/TfdA family dioxygenase [Agrobacterium tumefaciens]NTE66248.1 TauD/TfdA family dioxygenase [Agrobacterium tumefaciens]